METDIRIVKVTPSGEIIKHPARYSAGNEWSFTVNYLLEDGRTFPGTLHHRRLKDAKAALAALPSEPTNQTAMFHDGQFVGVTYHYGMVTAWPVGTLS